jgi:hypothetical protein
MPAKIAGARNRALDRVAQRGSQSSIAPNVTVTRIMWGRISYGCMMLQIVILGAFPEIATGFPIT